MIATFLRPFLPLLTVLALSVISAFAQTSVNAPGTGVITGRITIGDKPASGVLVGLARAQPTTPAEGGTLTKVPTDAEGRYRLAQVPTGSFRVTPLAPGYVIPSDNPGYFDPGKALNLREGETVENLDFDLKPGGVITGKVMDAAGKPLIEQRLTLLRLEANGRKSNFNPSPTNFYLLMTDDLGVYRIYGLPEGQYLIAAGLSGPNSSALSVRGISYKRTFYPDTTDENQAQPIEVTPGSEVKDIDIRLVPETVKSQTLLVRTVDAETGAPLAGITVGYMPMVGERMQGGFNTGMTDGQGVARFEGVPAGRYGAALLNIGSNTSEYFSDPVIVEVTENELEPVTIRALRGAVITGKAVVEGVTDPALVAQLSELRMSAYSRPATPSNNTFPSISSGFRINRDGSFRIAGLAPGKVQFSNYSGGQATGFSIARIEVEGVPQKDGVEVAAGQQIANVRLVFAYGQAVVRGQVQIIGGALPEGTMINVFARRLDSPTTISGRPGSVDARGRFTIEGLAAGEYELTLSTFSRTIFTSQSSGGTSTVTTTSSSVSIPRTVKQQVIVPASGEVAVTMTLDLTPKEDK